MFRGFSIHTYRQTYVHACMHTHIHSYIHIHRKPTTIHTYTHIHIHTYTHTYIHTYTQKSEAASYLAVVGERARRIGVMVDIFVASLVSVGVDALQQLTTRTGGDVVAHSSYGPSHTNAGQTHFSSMRTDLINSCRRSVGSAGVFDVHASVGVRISRVIGPLVAPTTREECDMSEDLPNMAMSPSVEVCVCGCVCVRVCDIVIVCVCVCDCVMV